MSCVKHGFCGLYLCISAPTSRRAWDHRNVTVLNECSSQFWRGVVRYLYLGSHVTSQVSGDRLAVGQVVVARVECCNGARHERVDIM